MSARPLPDKICASCQRPFHPDKSARKYCSVGCSIRSTTKFPPRPCKGCGKEFAPSGARQVFHTIECRDKWYSVHGKKPPRHKVAVTALCAVCSNPFVKKQFSHVTCSEPCQEKLSRHRTRENQAKAQAELLRVKESFDPCSHCSINKALMRSGKIACWMAICPQRKSNLTEAELDANAYEFGKLIRVGLEDTSDRSVLGSGCRRVGKAA